MKTATRNETRNETMNGKTTFIHGENGISIAAIFEMLLLPNHPHHAQAVVLAEVFVKAQKQEDDERSSQMMRDQMQHISEDEWSRIVD